MPSFSEIALWDIPRTIEMKRLVEAFEIWRGEERESELYITRALLAKLAPHELSLFSPISEAYFRDPQAVFAGRGYKEDMIGFGPETSKVLLTPVVLAVVADLFRFWERATDTAKEEELFVQIHKRAFETACQLKLPESQARALANVLVEILNPRRHKDEANLESPLFKAPDQSALG